MKSIILLCLCSFFIVPAISQPAEQSSKWSSIDRTDFIVECVKAANAGMSEDSAKYYCYCMLGKIEAKYPNPADAAALDADNFNSPEWKKIIQGCLGSYWTSSQRNDFTSSCIKAATPGIGEPKAKSYCDCMMFKIEYRYHSYAEASKLSTEQLQTPEWKKIIQSCLE